jgi:MFS family permease
MNFMKTVQNIDSSQVDMLLGIALLLGTPFFVFFGWLSDKIGRKSIMMTGMLLAIFLYRPIYRAMYQTTDLVKKEVVSVQKNIPIQANYEKKEVYFLSTTEYSDGTLAKETFTTKMNVGKIIPETVKTTVQINNSDKGYLIFLVFIQVIFVTMVYGPIAAFLVEMFPVKIRYTSMSLPYHVGNGIFGGLLPAISTYLVTNSQKSGNPQFYLEGLWYPILVASICFIIGIIYLDKKNNTTHD